MKTRLLIFVVIFGFGAIAVGWVYERNQRSVEEKAELVIPDDIDYYLTNMNYRALDTEGKLNFEFYTPRLEHYPHNDTSSIELPSMRIHSDSEPWQVDSLSGEYRHAQNLLHLTRQVVMQKSAPTPIEIFTESVIFEPDRDLVTADSEILMHSPQGRIRADFAEFDLAGKVYKFTRARAVYHDENS